MFARKGVGAEIAPGGVTLALLGGSAKAPRLEGFEQVVLPAEVLRVSRREPNVLETRRFVSAINEARLKLPSDEKGISLSIPDACGRVMLLDLEARFKNREEGAELIRWKLKKSLPYDIAGVQLDYQTLAERENGALTVLVSMVAREVVTQYEDLFAEAGIEARRIDFTSFSLYRLFANRLDLAENGALVSYYGGALNIFIFYGGILSFYRSKALPGDGQALFREINSSLLVYNDRNPGQVISEIFCLADAADAEVFRAVVAEASGIEPVLLDPERVVARPNLKVSRETFHALTGSIGAALRSLR
ncbi:pilus assembly protein PilM [Geomonas sp. Red875]|uniref:Pilus assembly protein PilM n=1 Tax=Geomesophilobacter sediminis TaxID=2798584 RepID=A0A8J7JMV5_9BACT|nr:pilus assembly protein PilM [Geomesophilobacter sediminis]